MRRSELFWTAWFLNVNRSKNVDFLIPPTLNINNFMSKCIQSVLRPETGMVGAADSGSERIMQNGLVVVELQAFEIGLNHIF